MSDWRLTDDAIKLVRRFISAGRELSERTHREILGLGAPGVPALLEILNDEDLALEDSPGGGWAPIHAARLLGEMQAVEAVEPMLRAFARTDPLDILHDQMIQSLPGIGAPVLEPALRAAAVADPEVQHSIAAVLARIGVRDERILDMLLAQLRHNPDFAGNLGVYGDPRALPHLLAAVDAYQLVESTSLLSNHALVELREAIEELGGTLTAEQQLKYQRGLRGSEVFRQGLRSLLAAPRRAAEQVEPAHRHDRPGRNDPCWCGSGRKYKKCHLAADEDASDGQSAEPNA